MGGTCIQDEETRNAYQILMGSQSLGRPRKRREVRPGIKMDHPKG